MSVKLNYSNEGNGKFELNFSGDISLVKKIVKKLDNTRKSSTKPDCWIYKGGDEAQIKKFISENNIICESSTQEVEEKETIHEKVHDKPHEKVHDKPHEKVHDKPHEKVHEKPHEKVHEKPHEKVHEKPEIRINVETPPSDHVKPVAKYHNPPTPVKKVSEVKAVNSPTSRRKLFEKKSPEYKSTISKEKLDYYKKLGKSRLELSSSSDSSSSESSSSESESEDDSKRRRRKR